MYQGQCNKFTLDLHHQGVREVATLPYLHGVATLLNPFVIKRTSAVLVAAGSGPTTDVYSPSDSKPSVSDSSFLLSSFFCKLSS
jgi:hypothetical protein